MGLRGDRRGYAHVAAIVVLGVVVAGSTLTLVLVPLGGLAGYNVQVNVGFRELAYGFGDSFAVTSVDGSVTGSSPAIYLGPLSFFGNVHSTFTATVCVAGHCASKSSSQWFPTIPFVNGAPATATDTFNVGNVPSGSQGISVTLAQNGETVATGSGTVCVGGGC